MAYLFVLGFQFVVNVLNVILECYLYYSPGVLADISCQMLSFMFDCHKALIFPNIIIDTVGLLYLFFMMHKGGILTNCCGYTCL